MERRDTDIRNLFRIVCASSLLLVFWNACEGVLQVSSVIGYGGETTIVICTDTGITTGRRYVWLKDTIVIYALINEGTVRDGKYNGTTQAGQINLQVLNTNISDAGRYQCSYNYKYAFGTLYVAYKPESITYTVTRGTVLELTFVAVKVYPNGSNITSVFCKSHVSQAIETFTANQSIISNIKDTFLFDISWIGTTANVLLTGDYVCTVNFMLIKSYITTVNVSFTEVVTSTEIPTSTSSDAATTEETEKDELKWWHIVLIVASVCVVVAVGFSGDAIYKRRIGKKELPEPEPELDLKELVKENSFDRAKHLLIDASKSETASKAKTTNKSVTCVELAITSSRTPLIDDSNSEQERKSKTSDNYVTGAELKEITDNNPDRNDDNISERQITLISLEPIDKRNPEEQQITPISPDPIDNT